jgi:hypothetical protein
MDNTGIQSAEFLKKGRAADDQKGFLGDRDENGKPMPNAIEVTMLHSGILPEHSCDGELIQRNQTQAQRPLF